MFNKEKTTSAQKQSVNSATIITLGTVFHGDVSSENDLRIDGVIHGNVSSTAKIVLGPSGFIEGNIDGKHADISGRVVGNITAQESIQLRPKCQVNGNIHAATFQAETGSVFNGQCHMGGGANVVSMTENEVLAKAQ
jgi:cytoskeletal protein CcmA (bactofilin family)